MTETKKKPKKVSKKNNKQKTKLDIHGKLVFDGILIALLFFGAIFMLSIANNIDIENKNVLMTYEDNSEVTYLVTTKQNNFYQTSTLGMNQIYPAPLMNNINITYKYNLKTSEMTNYNYRYFATATIVINKKDNDEIPSNDKILLTRTYQLLNEVTGDEKNKANFDVEKTLTINYDIYNNFVTSYQNTYNINELNDTYVFLISHAQLL